MAEINNKSSPAVMVQKSLLIILPDKDFDVTETSVPWEYLTNNGIRVEFATESGKPGEGDPLLLTGVLFGKLGASPEAKNSYSQMIKSTEFQNPATYENVNFFDYDAVLLPGGHAQGMKSYLENLTIQNKLAPYIKDESKILAAVCHGVIVLARALDPDTGKSLLFQRNSTCLPKYMEKMAYYLTAWKLGRYYRTYEEYVEDEVRASMKNPSEQFQQGTKILSGSLDDKFAFVCIHGNYISARWPGDVLLLSKTILDKLRNTSSLTNLT